MDYVPKFRLYDSTGIVLLYEFLIVQKTNHPQSPVRSVEIEGQRGIGSIIIDGGTKAWDLILSGIIDGVDYDELTSKIDTMESAVAPNTPYILKINKTETTYYE